MASLTGRRGTFSQILPPALILVLVGLAVLVTALTAAAHPPSGSGDLTLAYLAFAVGTVFVVRR